MSDPTHRSGPARSFGMLTAGALILGLLAAWVLWRLRPVATQADATVVLYTSADDEIARAVLDAFQSKTRVRVRVVGDTEATKSTGLTQRLLDEREASKADVWWSSEPLGTVRLARAGVFDTTWPASSDAVGDEDRPSGLMGNGWRGISQRARVLLYNTNRVKAGQAPSALRELTDPRWKGQVALAKPQFGTTRSHLAFLVSRAGRDATRDWLVAMKENGVHLYDGNAAVTRGVAFGEVTIGLADTDDAQEARRNNWPVAAVFERHDAGTVTVLGLPSYGPLLLPNTVGVTAHAPHPESARRLADYLCSSEVERIMAAHTSRHIPVREEIRRDFADQCPPNPAVVESFDALEDSAVIAMTLVEEVFGAR